MSLEAFFKSLSMTKAVRDSRDQGRHRNLPGQRLLPDQLRPRRDQPGRHAGRAEDASKRRGRRRTTPARRRASSRSRSSTTIPGRTRRLMRFRERHQDPKMTDIEYAARINNLDGVDGFIKAHSGAPWFVSMVGFVAGLPFLYQMVERERQIEVAEISAPAHRHAEAHRRPWRLLRLHLFGARRRRLPDVRHHADADLRPQAGDQLSARLHVPVQARRHREVEADRPRRL